jgi:5-formyltetrahydrofolate cyclo-ligase
MLVADEKKYLRTILKRTRATVSESLALALCAQIQSRFVAADFYRQTRTVVLYAACDNEVATGAIFDHALASGRAVLYPRLDLTTGALRLGRVRSRTELSPGAFGILEPAPTVESAGADLLERCVVAVPGLAFSPLGERLGRGGGHYDRLLCALGPDAVAVGLAYSFQLLDRVVQADGDRRLAYVVTESAVYAAGAHRGRGGGFEQQQGGIPR